jgi:hypothetical protein
MEHSFDIEVAQEYGIAEAIFIKHFQFWIKKNKANKTHLHDGRTWTYNSIKAFMDLFPYMSQKTIRTTLEHLRSRGVLITGNYNDDACKRTLWYSFADEEKWICQIGLKQMPKTENANADDGKCINTDIDYTDNKPNKETTNNISPSIPQRDECEEISQEKILFEEFRKIYLGTKRGLDIEFANFCKKHKDWREVLPYLKVNYERQIEAKKSQRGSIDPRYEKHLQTYINQRCWEEEISYGSNSTTNTKANNQQNDTLRRISDWAHSDANPFRNL